MLTMDAMLTLTDNQKEILLIGLTCVFVIVAYGTYRCKTKSYTDPLTGSLFGPPLDKFLDGWGISHMLFYMALSYHYPGEWRFIWLMGVAWEIIECIFKDHPFYLSTCDYQASTVKGEGWWYGRWQDIVMNSIGIYLGMTLTNN